MEVIKFLQELQSFKGSAYGVPAPILFGFINISNKDTYDTSALEGFLIENLFLKKEDTQILSNDKNQALLLIEKLFYWYNKIHYLSKMPLSKKTHIQLISSNSFSNTYKVVFSSFDIKGSTNILLTLLNLFNSYLLDLENKINQNDFQSFLQNLKQYSLLGLNNHRFIEAALELDIPYKIIENQLLVFGQGQYTKEMMSSSTNNTSNIGTRSSKLKQISSKRLKMNGFPIAQQLAAPTLNITLNHAKELGYPVVLKPVNEDQGRGVSSNITNEKELKDIYIETLKKYKNLIIEKHIFGEDYRFTVVNNKVIKVFKRTAGGVIGDGKSTIKELVKKVQNTPNNKNRYLQKGYHLIQLDEEALKLLNKNNYSPDSILEKNTYLPLRAQNNISTGGKETLIQISQIHPDNLELALKVSKLFHLDMVGVDIISPDITQSWLNTNTVVCEVNAIPEIGFTTTPHIYKYILQNTLKKGTRIPIKLFIINHKLLRDNQFINNTLKKQTYKNFSIGNIVVINNEIYTNKASNAFESAQILLTNKEVEKAYCFISTEIIEKFGLPSDKFDSITIDTTQERYNAIKEIILPYSKNILLLNNCESDSIQEI